jgi:hypothetical protein
MSAQTNETMKAWEPDARQTEYSKVLYFNLKDGETAAVRILDMEPKQVFMTRIEVGGKRYPVTVAREDNERVKAAGNVIRKVNIVNVLDRRDGKVKIWEFSEEKKGQIHATSVEWEKHPTQFDIAVTRKGEKLDTRYSVTITPNMKPLSEGELTLAKVDLDEYYKINPERLNALLKGQVPPKKEETEKEAETESDESTTATTLNPLDDGADVL